MGRNDLETNSFINTSKHVPKNWCTHNCQCGLNIAVTYRKRKSYIVSKVRNRAHPHLTECTECTRTDANLHGDRTEINYSSILFSHKRRYVSQRCHIAMAQFITSYCNGAVYHIILQWRSLSHHIAMAQFITSYCSGAVYHIILQWRSLSHHIAMAQFITSYCNGAVYHIILQWRSLLRVVKEINEISSVKQRRALVFALLAVLFSDLSRSRGQTEASNI